MNFKPGTFMQARVAAILAVVLASLNACGGGQKNSPPTSDGTWYQPALSVTWQWQLQGTLNTGYDVELYDIDLFDTSSAQIAALQANGHKVICYFSGGSYENWRNDATDFDATDLGNTLDGWAGERWLDIRSDNVRNIMRQRLDLARDKGCDGVEPDNMDGYVNSSGFSLNAADQLAYNRFIATESHARELAVGLKNDLDQVDDLLDDFDFAVNEQCFEYAECDLLQPFIDAGKPVLNAEYLDSYVNDQSARDAMCAQSRGCSSVPWCYRWIWMTSFVLVVFKAC